MREIIYNKIKPHKNIICLQKTQSFYGIDDVFLLT